MLFAACQATHRAALFLLTLALGTPAAAGFPCPAAPIRLAYFDLGHFHHEGSGLDVDLVAELQQRTGCSFATSVRPRARIWKELEVGTMDMTVAGLQTPQRTGFAWFFPYVRQRNHALVDSRLSPPITTMDEFIAHPQRPQWGVVRGFFHGDEFEEALGTLRTQKRIVEATDSVHLLKLLTSGRVAGIFSLPLVFQFEQGRQGLPPFVTINDWQPRQNAHGTVHHLVLSRKRFGPTEAQAWSQVLAQMHNDGTIARLLARYLDASAVSAALVKPR